MRKFFSKNQLFLSFVLIIASIHLLPVAFDLAKKETNYTTRLMLNINHGSGAFANYVKDGARYYWDHYIDLVDTSVENSRLRAQLQEMEAQNLMLTEIRLENERLRSLLNYKSSFKGENGGSEGHRKQPFGLRPWIPYNRQRIIFRNKERDLRCSTMSGAIGTVHLVNEKNLHGNADDESPRVWLMQLYKGVARGA